MTLEKNVDIAIRNYIDKNIKNRYKLTNIDFLIKYKDLRNQDILKWKNTWNPQLTVDDKFNKIQTETESDDSKIKVIFEQDKPSDTYNYDYYFNIFYEK
jgi:hypothetical protein